VVYLLAGGVAGLAPGLYRYIPQTHGLEPLAGEDLREQVFEAALRQSAIRKAPAVLLLSAAWESMTSRYGRRGIRYVYMEAGHAAQNVTLQAVALGLGSVVIGAFEDERLLDSLSIPRTEHPLYLIPVGRC
jgi:SagB-type dehydrogenase family enzyme